MGVDIIMKRLSLTKISNIRESFQPYKSVVIVTPTNLHSTPVLPQINLLLHSNCYEIHIQILVSVSAIVPSGEKVLFG